MTTSGPVKHHDTVLGCWGLFQGLFRCLHFYHGFTKLKGFPSQEIWRVLEKCFQVSVAMLSIRVVWSITDGRDWEVSFQQSEAPTRATQGPDVIVRTSCPTHCRPHMGLTNRGGFKQKIGVHSHFYVSEWNGHFRKKKNLERCPIQGIGYEQTTEIQGEAKAGEGCYRDKRKVIWNVGDWICFLSGCHIN